MIKRHFYKDYHLEDRENGWGLFEAINNRLDVLSRGLAELNIMIRSIEEKIKERRVGKMKLDRQEIVVEKF
ncbi:MAG: hypothetical protein IT292_01440 [Deltaproteobacteria bacterium]|nr:hypothetical protein [Deltaproteobacteria bacterium]